MKLPGSVHLPASPTRALRTTWPSHVSLRCQIRAFRSPRPWSLVLLWDRFGTKSNELVLVDTILRLLDVSCLMWIPPFHEKKKKSLETFCGLLFPVCLPLPKRRPPRPVLSAVSAGWPSSHRPRPENGAWVACKESSSAIRSGVTGSEVVGGRCSAAAPSDSLSLLLLLRFGLLNSRFRSVWFLY